MDMRVQPVLAQVALGYAPMIDRQRMVSALRLTVFPLRPEAPPPADLLIAAVTEAWPAEGGRVSLNVVSETLLHDLLAAELPPNLMLEVPAFVAAQPQEVAALRALHGRGTTLLLKGRPREPLARDLLPCFAYAIVDVAEERRDGAPAPGTPARQIPHVQEGVRTLKAMNEAFARGAHSVLGWPLDDEDDGAAVAPGKGGQPEMQTVTELIKRVDREENADRLEAVLKNDPALAFKLMRYINSPLFGLRVEITSFRHALMLLGYGRLKRWLALLLVSAGKDANSKPIMYAAVRRGLLMEELGRNVGADDEQRGELFICGMFSLLHRLMRQPLEVLLTSIPVPERVRQALLDETGPFRPILDLVRAVEASALYDIRTAAEALMMGLPEVNRAVFKALSEARQLE
ncbi:MAG: EAL and HDOD domain-containing protein [Aquabacterium sp.]